MKKSLSILIISTLLIANNAFGKLPENISDLVKEASPSVVNITSKREVASRGSYGYGIPDEFLERFGIPREFRESPQQKREALSYGSGFIFKDNYILTNYHVVEDATEVVVSLSDRREFVANVIGIDPLSDLAVLEVEGQDLPAVNIGNYVPFLQTDVAINPGNSGGPLFNLEGGVVGINSQIYSRSGGYQGLAFSIPINVALDVADQIITNGEVKRGYLGVRMSEVDSDLADALGMSKPYGALINDVEDGESADNAGLQPGDVIIEFNKKEIKFSSDLPHVVGQIKPGSNAKGKVIRDGKTKILNFTLGELPSSNDRFIPAKATTSDDPLGLKVAEIDRDNPAMANAPDGVMVTRVNPGSPASGKILRGDIISMIQSKSKKYEIYDTDDFEFVVEELNSDDKVAVHIYRNGSRIITSLKVN